MQKEHCTAIVLSAGQGKRMKTNIQKQYLEIEKKPVIYYALQAFEQSEIIDEIILVVGEGQEEFCKSRIVDKYKMQKVQSIIAGGAERYESVYQGLKQVTGEGFVFIHDGARPLITDEIITRAFEEVKKYKACVVGMPVKDTIKKADREGFAVETPERKQLWLIQTPQVFETALIKRAYCKLLKEACIQVTDDAMVLEQMERLPVRLVKGSYENIKITTPEDLEIAELFLMKRRKMQLAKKMNKNHRRY